jgi:hypothetical protein
LWHSPVDTEDYCAPLVSPTVRGSHMSSHWWSPGTWKSPEHRNCINQYENLEHCIHVSIFTEI